jgi:hypothetical protein
LQPIDRDGALPPDAAVKMQTTRRSTGHDDDFSGRDLLFDVAAKGA